MLYFPFETYWWFYAGFTAFVLAMLLLDLGVFHKVEHVVSVKEATTWSVIWMTLAIVFMGILYLYSSSHFGPVVAHQLALEFLTGFVIEKTLAIDNIFVFVVIFSFFRIPQLLQHRVLYYGIIGALIFRALFIALGASLMNYQFVVIAAGIFLMITGAKIFFGSDKQPDPGANPILKWIKRWFPVSDTLDGKRFFVRRDGKVVLTPLFLALLMIEFSDIIFAIDSVPAIFAVTKEPFLVFTSNLFAILGLRSLYFILAGSVVKFPLLKYGLGLILVFVGSKMAWLTPLMDGHFPITWSLGIIAAILVGSIVLSLFWKPRTRVETPLA